ncbi:MAG TPA: AbrB/MazE/SpoVT family DNA-binding domain-containing protein [Gammaproteobacteria bacterium]|nr:AbrB/MazE/SpoVT family DNA-binding domain-containing protein [Gammaproteobacteria bacterium]
MQVVISPKFQIVIPKEIRESMHLRPGEKLCVFRYQNRLEFIPVKDIKKMRGFLEGIETVIDRDKDRL